LTPQGDGTRCPRCGSDTSVLETRANRGSLRRRRRCLHCPGRVTTIELAAPDYSKLNTTELIAMPSRAAAGVEIVSRSLMTALREALFAGDVTIAAPEDECTC